MGKLTELEQWEDDIYQIETSDPVLGGPDGITNKPARQLSNRTQWLKAQLAAANKALAAHERSRNHPDATLTEKGFTKLYSGVMSLDETMAATPKAVKIAMDNANARLAKDRNGADIPNVALFRQNIELGNSATRNVGTTINTVAAGDDPRFSSSVPVSRTVNGHILDADINITSPDIFNDQAIPLGDLNLDTITTPGIYYQDDDRKASLALNYPVAAKGTLIVLKGYNFTSGSNGQRVRHPIQIFYAYTMQYGNPIYSRRIPPSGLVFGGWAQDYNTLNPPTAAAVGAYSTTESYNQTQISQILTRYVPYDRKINNKFLIRDIILSAADVGTDTTAQIDIKVADAKKAGTDANTNANSRVPNTRTINGKPLLTDIILTAADLGILIPQNTATLANSGVWMCGDTGLIIQWGELALVPDVNVSHEYPLNVPFPVGGGWVLGVPNFNMGSYAPFAGASGIVSPLIDFATEKTLFIENRGATKMKWIAIGF